MTPAGAIAQGKRDEFNTSSQQERRLLLARRKDQSVTSLPTDETVERMAPAFIEELQEFCAVPSVSSDAEGCQRAVEFLIDAMHRRGIETQLVETETNPIIYGVKRGATDKSILFYAHYDVVPSGDPAEWDSPAFEPTIREDRIWGRGVADHKGSAMARIQALDLLEARGDEPQ